MNPLSDFKWLNNFSLNSQDVHSHVKKQKTKSQKNLKWEFLPTTA